MPAHPERPASDDRRFVRLAWVGLFLGLLGLYALTAQRGCGWEDSGWFQWRIIFGRYESPSGLCTVHPLYIALGQVWLSLLPGVEPCTSLNIFSGVGLALALANLAVFLWRLTGNRFVSVAFPLLLGVGHTPWWLATIAESYTWGLAGFTLELLILWHLLHRPSGAKLALLAFVSGLGWGLNNLALLALPAYGWVTCVLWRRGALRARHLAPAALAYLVGATPMLLLIGHAAAEGGGLWQAVGSALWGPWKQSVFRLLPNLHTLAPNLALVALNGVNLLAPLALLGLWRLRRLPGLWGGVLALLGLVHGTFFLRYDIEDLFTFVLPSLTLAVVLAAHGAATLRDRPVGWRVVVVGCAASLLLGPLVYGSLPGLLKRAGVTLHRNYERPLRDELRFFITPWKHNERSAEAFADAALREAAPRGLLLCGYNALYPLRLLQRRQPAYRAVSVRQIEKHSVRMTGLLRGQLGRPAYVVNPWLLRGVVPNLVLDHSGLLYRVISLEGPAAAGAEAGR